MERYDFAMLHWKHGLEVSRSFNNRDCDPRTCEVPTDHRRRVLDSNKERRIQALSEVAAAFGLAGEDCEDSPDLDTQGIIEIAAELVADTNWSPASTLRNHHQPMAWRRIPASCFDIVDAVTSQGVIDE